MKETTKMGKGYKYYENGQIKEERNYKYGELVD